MIDPEQLRKRRRRRWAIVLLTVNGRRDYGRRRRDGHAWTAFTLSLNCTRQLSRVVVVRWTAVTHTKTTTPLMPTIPNTASSVLVPHSPSCRSAHQKRMASPSPLYASAPTINSTVEELPEIPFPDSSGSLRFSAQICQSRNCCTSCYRPHSDAQIWTGGVRAMRSRAK
jgi:hypothetical protein